MKRLSKVLKQFQKPGHGGLSHSDNSIINKTVNYNYLISKLQCDDLSQCPCVKFVNKLKLNNLDNSLGCWLPNYYNFTDKWCPLGPPPYISAAVSVNICQEEEEDILSRKVMSKELELYEYDEIVA